MHGLAASIGSDVPFFLQSKPALAVGRGEQIESVDPFPALAGKSMLLVHPGFGVSTAWAYQHLAEFTDALNGKPGRAQKLIQLLGQADLRPAAAEFYNALEFPVLRKYPLLAIIREFLEREGAIAARMSGSGSTLFGIIESEQQARVIEQRVRDRFASCWTAVVPV
jgi:4-diphosphocytidyl-2-C-methyl-D-erythritol kinase